MMRSSLTAWVTGPAGAMELIYTPGSTTLRGFLIVSKRRTGAGRSAPTLILRAVGAEPTLPTLWQAVTSCCNEPGSVRVSQEVPYPGCSACGKMLKAPFPGSLTGRFPALPLPELIAEYGAFTLGPLEAALLGQVWDQEVRELHWAVRGEE